MRDATRSRGTEGVKAHQLTLVGGAEGVGQIGHRVTERLQRSIEVEADPRDVRAHEVRARARAALVQRGQSDTAQLPKGSVLVATTAMASSTFTKSSEPLC